MQGKEFPVTIENVVSETMRMKNEGYRLVSMTCRQTGDGEAEIIYHFDRDLSLVHLRMSGVDLKQNVPSISGVFFAAIIGENEMRDQYDITFDGLALDFNRSLLLDEEISAVTVPMVNNVKIDPKEGGAE
ncbi:NADH-quinone oxidoreductase subunit C [Desulfovibrio oxyclinae]|uniref:NADH-quinone oxidoreductase subunit C n=1 Tax=Desulfovibrio oxyclinae TaxID=63560 RepID=UPI000369EF84|nr:NADH-quinone oxidoreductase subunit C [Desulfovibrio oxyclinae]